MCERCEQQVNEMGDEYKHVDSFGAKRCLSCDRTLQKDFDYCPYCGKKN